MVGIQTLPDPVEAIEEAQCVFIGGGNTFKLLKHLYDADLIEPIRRRVLAGEMAYMGSSAGTNVATTTINLTNDMPITWPPSYEAIGVVPIHLNTHYIDTDPDSLHQGETREDRINEFLNFCEYPVLALREGTALLLDNGRVTNLGTRWARLLKKYVYFDYQEKYLILLFLLINFPGDNHQLRSSQTRTSVICL